MRIRLIFFTMITSSTCPAGPHGRSAEPAPVCDAVAYRGDEVIPLSTIVVHRNAQPVSHGLQKTFYNGNIICHLARRSGRRRYLGMLYATSESSPTEQIAAETPPFAATKSTGTAVPAILSARERKSSAAPKFRHKIIAGAARNTCHLCVFIGIRPRKYLVQSTVPAAGVKAHRFPVITVLPGDFSRVAGVLCQLHSIIHTQHRPPRRSAAAQDKGWRPLSRIPDSQ